MGNSLTLEEIKAKIDIISLAESYGFEFDKPRGTRYRAKQNLLRDEKTSSLDFFEDSQKFYDRGTGSGGDCIDLVQIMDNLSQNDAISKIKSMAGADTYSVEKREYKPATREPKEKKEIDLNKLSYIAKKEIAENIPFLPKVQENEQQAPNGFVKKRWTNIRVHSEYHKLFETSTLDIEYKAKLDYIFKNILGYSNFWKSPTIILHNQNNQVIDIVAYRPKNKDTGEEIPNMKYYYKNQNNRGSEFIYPFENLVKRIAEKEKYIVVGEGLKNAVNALIYNVPFITIESTSNTKTIDEKLLNSINDFLKKGFGLVTAFDGDEAGKKAFESFLSLTGLSAENLFAFDSGIDFTEYVQGNINE